MVEMSQIISFSTMYLFFVVNYKNVYIYLFIYLFVYLFKLYFILTNIQNLYIKM